jgi:hypothetical protein
MAAFNIQLQGFPAANRDANIRLVNQLTGVAIERKPFLDGSLLVRDLDPGNYELEVTHPNLFQPIDRRIVRLFPQPLPTIVPVPVPEDLFRDTPIRETPDADLTPVQQAATGVRDRLAPIGGKSPGEAIRAADWNVLVGAVSDLAGATLELSNLVSPRGHDHPEIEEKIGEVQGNIRRFAEAFGRSLLELRREIETANLRRTINDVIDLAPAEVQPAARERLLGRIEDLRATVPSDTPTFTQKLSSAGNLVLSEVNELAVAAGAGADDFRNQPVVQTLVNTARSYQEAGTQVRPENELQTYLRTTRTTGGQLTNLIGG